MYYAIIRQVATSAEAEYTGVVYEEITESTLNNHKEQSFFIEPTDVMIKPINEAEIREYEINMMMSSIGPSGNIPIPSEIGMEPMPIYPSVTKDNAFNAIKYYIDKYKDTKNKESFIYDNISYKPSTTAINAVYTLCLSLSDTDPIPTQNGVWKGYDNNGDIVYTQFTVGEFKSFANALFARSDGNFFNKETHITNIKNMVDDDTKTITDILNYDYTTGWSN
jgi:hypothetical protein